MRKNGTQRTFIGWETETNVGHLLQIKRCLSSKRFGKNRAQTERNYHAICQGKFPKSKLMFLNLKLRLELQIPEECLKTWGRAQRGVWVGVSPFRNWGFRKYNRTDCNRKTNTYSDLLINIWQMFNLGTDDLAVKPYIPHKSLLQWICCKCLAW